MEWQIMNCGGLNGLTLGTWLDDQYHMADDCYETLTSIMNQLKEDEQTTRRQLASSHIIQKDLVPLLMEVEDDPEVFCLTVKLLVILTQPVEYMWSTSQVKVKNVGPRPQYWEIGKMLLEAKVNCTVPKFIWALIREVKKIIVDTGEYDMEERDCEIINQCLLLMRNLLYIQDTAGGDNLSPVHMGFLKNLFQMGIDHILMFVLNAKQKDYWGATVVQVLSLLYRDLVGEIFLRFDTTSKCWDEPCDSSNCSACEAALDRASILQPYLKTSTYRNSRSSPEPSSSSCGSPVLMKEFEKLCTLSEQQDMKNWKSGKQKMYKEDSSDDRGSSVSSSDSPDTLQSYESECSSVEELGACLIEFTPKFIQGGFSSLVHVLKTLLIKNKDFCHQSKLDDSYFLWIIAFFLKVSRRKELNIKFKNIKDVFTADVVGFLVYKAFSNGEEVFLQGKGKNGNDIAMKRLHLCVSALRELFKTLSHHLNMTMTEEDRQYLNKFQKNLANMSDLRLLFLWLIRQYDPACHSLQFLQDTIITNHYLLLLLEVWIEQKLCVNPAVTMLTHVSQFATADVMKNYGHLLRNFAKNDHHVNNCIFTMMHHVAGDCRKPDALLHINILNTFLQLWDSKYPVTQVMNDLMEYVMQKFISKAERAPLECALQLFNDADDEGMPMAEDDTEKMDEGNWTAEEEDKLLMWYSELEGNPDPVEKIVEYFYEIGIRKTKVEIVNKLYESNWVGSDEVQNVIKFDKDLQGLQVGPNVAELHALGQNVVTGNIGTWEFVDPDVLLNETDETLQFLNGLFTMEEGQFVTPMDLSDLEEDRVITLLVDNLHKQGFSRQLKFVQWSLLEAAYVKLDAGHVDKEQVEEPIMKHCVDIGQPIPLAPFSDDQDVISSNIHMRLLLHNLGFYVGEDAQSPYPRMPHRWTTSDLVEKAKLLGEIDPGDVKFELDSVMAQGTTPVMHNMDRNSCIGDLKV